MYAYANFNGELQRQMSIIDDLRKAINGEYTAIFCYEQLARQAPTEEERKRIVEIRNDEIGHLRVFSAIYRNLTGRQPTPQIMTQCPATYRDGLRFALEDEQETVDFYLDIADQTRDPYIKDRFRRAAADEQNHAVWFLYFLTH